MEEEGEFNIPVFLADRHYRNYTEKGLEQECVFPSCFYAMVHFFCLLITIVFQNDPRTSQAAGCARKFFKTDFI